MNINEKLQHEDGEEMTDGRSFRSLVDKLIYLTLTRPALHFLLVLFLIYATSFKGSLWSSKKKSYIMFLELWSMKFGILNFLVSNYMGSLIAIGHDHYDSVKTELTQ